MHPSHHPVSGQQQRVRHYASNADSYAMFNLLTGPQLFDRVEALLPEHRERLFPPTETLSMFLAQALSADGSCQQVVNDAMVKRVIGGLKPGSTDTGGYCKARSRLPVSMVSTLARESGGPVLELGCGTGGLTQMLRQIVDRRQVVLGEPVTVVVVLDTTSRGPAPDQGSRRAGEAVGAAGVRHVVRGARRGPFGQAGHQGHAGENPRRTGTHRRGGPPAPVGEGGGASL